MIPGSMGGSLDAVPGDLEGVKKTISKKKLYSVGAANSMEPIDQNSHSYFGPPAANRYNQSTDASNQY